MKIIENDSYHKRLMMYRGLLGEEKVLNVDSAQGDGGLALATQGYGVGNWHLYNQDTVKALEIFQKVLEGDHFSSFGFIAAEVEKMRLTRD